MAGWQPISTAPKDGEAVVVAAYLDGMSAVAAYFNGRWDNAVTGRPLDFEPDGWRPLGGGS